MPLKFSPTILALAALLSAPALAQYDAPPRPPGSIDYPPGQQPYPDQRPNPDQRYPRAQPYPPPQQPYPPQARDPRYDPRDPRAVQSQPLPPPPGTQPQPAPRQDTRQVLPPPGYDAPPAQPKAKAKAEPKSKTAPKQAAPAQDAPEAAEVPVEQAPVQRISNPTAVFSGLDKITGRIISFEAAIDETVQFGALQVTPRACYTRPPTEIQNTTAFVEVDEITLAGDIKRIFTGWMFANSPGLNAVEHPIYDVWITDCKTTPPAIAQSGGKQ
jgi:hypothetical protein